MRHTFTALVLAIGSLAQAGGDGLPVGARSAGLAHANLTLIDLWSVRGNQAGLAGLERPMAGLGYQQHWLSPDLALQALAFAMPLGNGTIAVSAERLGLSLYQAQQFGLA